MGTRRTPGATIDHTQLSLYNFKQNLKSELLVTSEVIDFSSKALWPSFMHTCILSVLRPCCTNII